MLVLSPPAFDMQALAETSLKMLKQLIEGRDTAACLEAGLQVVLQVQVQWPDGIGAASTSQPCCLQSFIQAKVRTGGLLFKISALHRVHGRIALSILDLAVCLL